MHIALEAQHATGEKVEALSVFSHLITLNTGAGVGGRHDHPGWGTE